MLASASANCRQEVTTGSNLSRRTCSAPMTDAERDAQQRDLTPHGQARPVLK